jgi:hypothetical protein
MQPTRRHLIQLAALPALLRAQEHQHRNLAASEAPRDPELLRDYQPTFFAAKDFEALESFTEILIPTDETPGAREARCAHYIDFVLQSTPNTNPWRAAMAALKDAGFHSADAKGRETLVAKLADPSDPNHAVFQLIKQQTAFAFYTSRPGMIETLDYRGNSFNPTFPACDHPEHHAKIL